MNRMNNKGFTLIELLVVIAIIGVLSSVVLVSLDAPTDQANDAAAKSEIRQIATYGILQKSDSAYNFATQFCEVTAATGVLSTTKSTATTTGTDEKILKALQSLLSRAGDDGVLCHAEGTAASGKFLVAYKLKKPKDTGKWLCVDDKGFSGEIGVTKTTAVGNTTDTPNKLDYVDGTNDPSFVLRRTGGTGGTPESLDCRDHE